MLSLKPNACSTTTLRALNLALRATILDTAWCGAAAQATGFILTGGPGSGKTSIAVALERRGEVVVHEAAKDIIYYFRGLGDVAPWAREDFQTELVRLQAHREAAVNVSERGRFFMERSRLDSVAYCAHRGRPLSDQLSRLLEQIDDSRYARTVFLIAGSGSIENTHYRNETHDEARQIERKLREVYAARGFKLIDVPYGPLEDRVAFILERVNQQSCESAVGLGPAGVQP